MKTSIREEKVGGIISQSQAVGKEWEIVIIETGLSHNGNFYPESTLREAVPLFEGHRVCLYQFGELANHLPAPVAESNHPDFAANVVGWLHDITYGKFTRPDGSSGEGIIGKFHVLEGFESLRKNLKDTWTHGKWDFLGFSIDAQALTETISMNGRTVRNVIKIQEVSSTDLVSRPAAGGNLLRLAASKGADGMKRILESIQKHRSSWFSGFAMIENGQNEQDYLLRVLESNLVKAQESQDTIHSDEIQKLAEVARGVKALNSVINMIRSNKIEEAVKILESWIGTHPEAKENAYTFPYQAPGIAKVAEQDPEKDPEKELEKDPEKDPGKEPEKDPEKELEKDPEKDPEKKTETTQESEKRMDLEKREGELIVKEKLLESGLSQPARDRVQELFKDKTGIIAEEIEKAIDAEKAYVKSIQEAGNTGNVAGLGGAHGNEEIQVGADRTEKIEKAFDGLFAGHDVDDVPMFSSLTEAWGECSNQKWGSREQVTDWIYESIALSLPQSFRQAHKRGDHKRMIESRWGEMASMNLREAVTTPDFPVAFGDALFRRLQKEYNDDPLNDWRQIVSNIENLGDATNDFNIIRLGATSTLPVVNENAPYQELTPVTPTEEVEKISPDKVGGLFKVTWEDVLADRVGVIRRIPRMLARSSNRTIHEAVWDEIENNPVTVTGDALISTAHLNLVTGSPALSYTAVTDAMQLLRDQTELDSGKRLGLRAALLLVGTKLENEAFEITDSNVKASGSEDLTVANFVGRKGVKTMSTLGLGRTAGTDDRWYVAASPRDAETIAIGFLGGRQTPDIFVQGMDTPTSGAFFTADAITFKIRLVFGTKVIDHRWIAGSLFNE